MYTLSMVLIAGYMTHLLMYVLQKGLITLIYVYFIYGFNCRLYDPSIDVYVLQKGLITLIYVYFIYGFNCRLYDPSIDVYVLQKGLITLIYVYFIYGFNCPRLHGNCHFSGSSRQI